LHQQYSFSPRISTFQATESIIPVILLLVGMCAVSVACLLKAPQHVDHTHVLDGEPAEPKPTGPVDVASSS